MYVPETSSEVLFEVYEPGHPRPVPERLIDDYVEAQHVLNDWRHMFPDRAFSVRTVH